MVKLNEKEKDYINLGVIVGDNQQNRMDLLWKVSPTWNIVNWLRARNITEGNFLTGRTLYYDSEVGDFESRKRYVETILLSNGIQPKYENGWK